jgi:rubrerythrin
VLFGDLREAVEREEHEAEDMRRREEEEAEASRVHEAAEAAEVRKAAMEGFHVRRLSKDELQA